MNRISQSLELSSRIQSSVIGGGGGGANNQQTTNQSQQEQNRTGTRYINLQWPKTCPEHFNIKVREGGDI